MGAIHDHATWVAISPIVGLETHRRYRLVGRGSTAHTEVVEVRALQPSDIATLLPPEDLHDHGHLAGHGSPAYVLIMTGDDQMRFRRNEWDLATGRHRILTPETDARLVSFSAVPSIARRARDPPVRMRSTVIIHTRLEAVHLTPALV